MYPFSGYFTLAILLLSPNLYADSAPRFSDRIDCSQAIQIATETGLTLTQNSVVVPTSERGDSAWVFTRKMAYFQKGILPGRCYRFSVSSEKVSLELSSEHSLFKNDPRGYLSYSDLEGPLRSDCNGQSIHPNFDNVPEVQVVPNESLTPKADEVLDQMIASQLNQLPQSRSQFGFLPKQDIPLVYKALEVCSKVPTLRNSVLKIKNRLPVAAKAPNSPGNGPASSAGSSAR